MRSYHSSSSELYDVFENLNGISAGDAAVCVAVCVETSLRGDISIGILCNEPCQQHSIGDINELVAVTVTAQQGICIA